MVRVRGRTFDITRLGAGIRVLTWLLCLGLAAIHDRDHVVFLWLVTLAIVGALADRWRSAVAGSWLRIAEVLLMLPAVLTTATTTSPFLPYLLAPAVGGGLAAGVGGAVLPPLVAAAGFVTAGFLADVGSASGYAAATAEWVLLSGLAGIIAALGSAQLSQPQATDEHSYVEAYRLLSQLRVVARELSAGLDPRSLGETMLAQLGSVMPYERGVVFVRSAGRALVPLCYAGDELPQWDAVLSDDSPFAEAWFSQEPYLTSMPLSADRPGARAAIIPLHVGVRTFGVVVLEAKWLSVVTREQIRAAKSLAEEAALRLETGLLFDEVREVATIDERNRLAREIHDGIAQELASLGYTVDDLQASAATSAPGLQDELQELRLRLTDLITELRLSIFELRSGVDTANSIGTAITEYVRSISRTSQLAVHLTIDESTRRLARDVEAELLRIAQEAITNARKHSSAANLWVQCSVDPPTALIRVEDDGVGLGPGRDDSYGLQIMKERAERVRATLQIRGREPRGTLVEVRLGVIDPAASESPRPSARATG